MPCPHDLKDDLVLKVNLKLTVELDESINKIAAIFNYINVIDQGVVVIKSLVV